MPRQDTGIRLEAEYFDLTGLKVDPAEPYAKIFDPRGEVKWAGVPTRSALGVYYVDFHIPADAVLGAWKIEWSGRVAGFKVREDFVFWVTK